MVKKGGRKEKQVMVMVLATYQSQHRGRAHLSMPSCAAPFRSSSRTRTTHHPPGTTPGRRREGGREEKKEREEKRRGREGKKKGREGNSKRRRGREMQNYNYVITSTSNVASEA